MRLNFCFGSFWLAQRFPPLPGIKNNLWGGVLAGSLTYCFCGFVLQKGIQHTFFILPMIFFPVMLLGADKIIKKQSPAVFVAATALCAVTNVYFFYMSVLAVVLYVCGRLGTAEVKIPFKGWLRLFGRFLLYGLLAVFIAGVILFPTAFSVLGTERIGAGNEVPAFYPITYYFHLFWGSGTNSFRDFDTRTGFAVPALLAVGLLLLGKTKRKLKLSFFVLLLFLCVPLAGSVFNGFGYVSNRWIFVFSFCIAYILTAMYADFLSMGEERYRRLLSGTGLFVLCGMSAALIGLPEEMTLYRSLAFLLVYVMLLGCFVRRKRRRMGIFIIAATVGSILLNAYFEYFPTQSSVLNSYIRQGDVLREYTVNLPSNALLEIPDIRRFRSDVSHAGNEAENSFMVQKLPGAQFYFSVTEDSVNRFLKEMEYNHPLEHQYDGMQDRLILNSLWSVKYFLTDGGDIGLESDPAFTRYETGEQGEVIYVNEEALPMAYLYETYILREDYERLNAADKQEALLQGAVVETSNLPKADLLFSNYEIDYDVSSDTIPIEGTRFFCSGKEQEAVLSLKEIPYDAEVYVLLEGIHYEGMDPITRDAGGDLDNVDWFWRQIIRSGQLAFTEADSASIDVRMGERTKTVTYDTPAHRMYCGRDSFLCNLGYVENGDPEIKLVFHGEGIYTIDRIRVVAQPRKSVETALALLAENSVNDWEIVSDGMNGTVSCDRGTILCVAVPYSKGWEAYVDGKPTEVKRINTAFMGVELSPGTHEISFVYHIPYGRLGLWSTFIGLAILAAVFAAGRRKRPNAAYGSECEGNGERIWRKTETS